LRRQVLLTRLLLLEARSIPLTGITLPLAFKARQVTQDRKATQGRKGPPGRKGLPVRLVLLAIGRRLRRSMLGPLRTRCLLPMPGSWSRLILSATLTLLSTDHWT
jgi:hypothetical protein